MSVVEADQRRMALCQVAGCAAGPRARELGVPASLNHTLSEKSAIGIDEFAAYDPQTSHRSQPQPGVVAFRDLVLSAFPGTGSMGILRPAQAAGRSEHKEGRAWDWRVCRECQNREAAELLGWLLAPDHLGRPCAAARRFGLMYIIWDSRIWGAYLASDGWRTYEGPDLHVDHVHFSFSWKGAMGATSWWGEAPVAQTC